MWHSRRWVPGWVVVAQEALKEGNTPLTLGRIECDPAHTYISSLLSTQVPSSVL